VDDYTALEASSSSSRMPQAQQPAARSWQVVSPPMGHVLHSADPWAPLPTPAQARWVAGWNETG
jgi:hypothetical protein